MNHGLPWYKKTRGINMRKKILSSQEAKMKNLGKVGPKKTKKKKKRKEKKRKEKLAETSQVAKYFRIVL